MDLQTWQINFIKFLTFISVICIIVITVRYITTKYVFVGTECLRKNPKIAVKPILGNRINMCVTYIG